MFVNFSPLVGGSPPTFPTYTIPIEQFDPGAQDPRRWNTAIESAMAYAAADGAFVLSFSSSTYVFTEQVQLTTTLYLLGLGLASVLSFTGATAGIKVLPAAAYSSFSGLYLLGPSPWVGSECGIWLQGNGCTLSALRLENWAKNGVFLDGVATNVNNTYGHDLTFHLCGHGGAPAGAPLATGAGLFADGADANASVFVKLALFDCRKGAYDSSFLGNVYIGSSAEGCNNRFDVPAPVPIVGCGFKTDDPSARCTFFGCYTESDSVGQVDSPSFIVGGLFQNTGTSFNLTSIGAAYNYVALYPFIDPNAPPGPDPTLPNRQITSRIGGADTGDAFSVYVSDAQLGTDVYLEQSLCWNQSAPGWWAFNYANLTRVDAFRIKEGNFWVPNDLQRGLNVGGGTYGMREAVVASEAAAVADGPSDGGAWRVGDRLIIAAPAAGAPSRYCCTSIGPAVFKVEATLAP